MKQWTRSPWQGSSALPLQYLQTSNLIEMSVTRGDGQLKLFRDRGDPNVILGNGRAGLRQRSANPAVVVGGNQTGRQNGHSRQKAGYFRQGLGLIRRKVGAAIEFSECRLREIESCAGPDLLPNRRIPSEISNYD